jgi:hypothetical protein
MARLCGALALLLVIAFTPAVRGEDDAAFYGAFAPTACCWTNKCCFEIGPDDVEDLGGGVAVRDTWGQIRTGHGYRIKASGQVVLRTDFSPDGKFHRCACDPLGDGRWSIHPKANTRCLFVPPFGS